MNAILEIIETRNLYSHLILFKLYLDSKGRINDIYNGNLDSEISELLGDEFSKEYLYNAKQWLNSKGYTKYIGSRALSEYGRDYLESWILNFEKLESKDKEILKEKLPEKVFKYFGIAADAYTVGTFIQTLQLL
ncbi:hypothetical protein [Aquimarina sp. MMG016]|uniref:hypothetical protein n=1 Tax=Aquimarina sp. MMG016 TaxID=2822690 RepID=UPI001B3A058C|nr:hypothetical protein [Aquimarina sp. MMG016]MBQ4818604.1 hypothetical protein [Aquimarina sp. MMG016]